MDHAEPADIKQLEELLEKWMAGSCTREEWERLLGYADEITNESQLEQVIHAQWQKIIGREKPRIEDWEEKCEIILKEDRTSDEIPEHRVHVLRTAWFRYAAAILIVFGVGYLYISNQKEEPSVTQTNPVPVQNDVAPGDNKAVLTLADGTKIILDSAANGKLAEQGKTTIEKKDGQIIYSLLPTAPLPTADSRTTFNTMSTPRGGQYQLTLPDGSQVWLNAESSITYPTAFSGKTREVTVTGEAYFEITKNKAKPFIVNCHPEPSSAKRNEREGSAEERFLQIEVLGTHFNVNTYKEESTKNITLLEGSVRLSTSSLSRLPSPNSVHTSLILKPGQQGQLNPRTEKLSLAANPDVEQVMAWKNGRFDFNDVNLFEAMRQLSRWYDVDIIYEGKVPEITFVGKMGRDLKLSQVLKGLDAMGVKFRIEGKKLIVTK